MVMDLLDDLIDFNPLGGGARPADVLNFLGLGGGSSGFENLDNLKRVAKAARKYGVPETLAVQLAAAESGFKTDALNPRSGASGLGQHLPSTAQGYGTTAEELRRNPDLAADLISRQLSENYRLLGDWDKAAAAYYLGGSTIQLASELPGDWKENATAIARKKGWLGESDPGVEQYLTKIGRGTGGTNRQSIGVDQLRSELGLQPKGSSRTAPDVDKLPNIEDYKRTLPDGTIEYDELAYQDALDNYAKRLQAKKLQKDLDNADLSQYIDDLIAQTSAEIAMGGLDLKRADSLLQGRVNSYKTMLDAYSDDAFKYAAPATGDYLPGGEPGGFWSQRGLNLPKVDRSITVDPLAVALQASRQHEQSVSGIRTSSLPDIASIRASGQVPGRTGSSSSAGPPGFFPNPTTGGAINQEQADAQTLAEQLIVQSQGLNQPQPQPDQPWYQPALQAKPWFLR